MEQILQIATQMSGQSQDWLWAALLVFLRVGAAMALMPAFGETVVPQRVRLVLTLAFTAVVLPASLSPEIAPQGVFAAGTEVMVGLMLGIGLRLFILALQTAGAIAASSMSLAQLFGGTGPEPQPAIGNLLTMAALALAVILGLHVKLASFFILSYQMLPAGIPLSQADVSQWGIAQISGCFVLSFSLAAPFVLASVVYNLALGVINKAMPQLMVTMVGAPLLTGGALLLMLVTLPLILSVWHEAFNTFLAQPYRVVP
jgi:flagellar biosynthetic protein FliR